MSKWNPNSIRSHRDASFESTRWSLVQAAGTDGTAARDALATLFRIYWYPVYGFIRRRKWNVDDALELTQSFFVSILEKNKFHSADQTRGRFRAFLLTSLKNFLANEHQKTIAQKRGSGLPVFSLDVEEAEQRWHRKIATPLTPEQEFDRQWAVELLNNVVERLEAEQASAGRLTQFQELRFFLTGQNAGTTYAEVANRLQIKEDAARAAVYRLRKRYQILLRDEIAQTVTSPEDVDDELKSLCKALDS